MYKEVRDGKEYFVIHALKVKETDNGFYVTSRDFEPEKIWIPVDEIKDIIETIKEDGYADTSE